MKTYYKAEVLKTSEEDNYELGCSGESKFFGIVGTYKALTLVELVKELETIYQEKPCFFEGENNRLEIQVMEDAHGLKASDIDMELFKIGKKRLWLVNYSCYVIKITRDSDIKNEIKTLNLETI